jgi:dTDP-4-dehydrorhamnose 3,5-epimerase
MRCRPLELPDLILIEPDLHEDERGSFLQGYQKKEFAAAGIAAEFVQDNHSISKQGVLRGLHYQIRQPQGKLIYVISGTIHDVAVDLRRRSAHFGRCASIQLSAGDPSLLWIPPGCAHGFYVLSERAEVLYKTTEYYAPQWERTLLWNDPALGIDWPLVDGRPPILSAKDAQGKPLSESETYD